MRTTAVTTPSYLDHSRPLMTGAISSRPGWVKRFSRAVETSDWDEDLLRQEKWLNGVCLAVIALAVLYLGPILLANLFG